MFAELKSIVDLVRAGVASYHDSSSAKARKKLVLGLLETYFLLLDCAEEGEQLILDAGSNPIEKIEAMESAEARAITLAKWGMALRKQTIRLRTLQENIFSQDHLTVINPTLQKEIEAIIGSKFDSTNNLFKIGAALFFHSVFPVATDREQVEGVLIMAGSEGDQLDIAKLKLDIAGLRESLEQYRHVLNQLVTSEEVLALSQLARKQTSLDEQVG
ncbi:MAG: hypothetical protein HY244_06885 [Rhizobiales bacterium]|nr:hypothetical protein [Hyphomicrobiales bacterium]